MGRKGGVGLHGALLGAALSLLPRCGGTPTRPGAVIDLAPFKQMARDATCADLRNRLFLIDGQLAFWDRVGSCSDNSYARTLFAASAVDEILCESHDSIAGPMGGCRDSRYRGMFDTIVANLDERDLGLGPAHTVQPIPF